MVFAAYCGICGETFRRYSKLVIHMRLAHKNAVEPSLTEQTYTITKRPRVEEPDVEDVDDDYRSEFSRLLYVAPINRPVSCNSSLLSERKFKCQICGLTYRFVAELTRHSKTHVNDAGEIIPTRSGDSRRRGLDEEEAGDGEEEDAPDVPEPRSKKPKTSDEDAEIEEEANAEDVDIEPLPSSPVKKPRKMMNFKNANIVDSTPEVEPQGGPARSNTRSKPLAE